MEAKLKKAGTDSARSKKSVLAEVEEKEKYVRDWVDNASVDGKSEHSDLETIRKEGNAVITEIHSLKNTVSSMLTRQAE